MILLGSNIVILHLIEISACIYLHLIESLRLVNFTWKRLIFASILLSWEGILSICEFNVIKIPLVLLKLLLSLLLCFWSNLFIFSWIIHHHVNRLILFLLIFWGTLCLDMNCLRKSLVFIVTRLVINFRAFTFYFILALLILLFLLLLLLEIFSFISRLICEFTQVIVSFEFNFLSLSLFSHYFV